MDEKFEAQMDATQVEQTLEASVPELLKGRLPQNLEDKLLSAIAPSGFTAYAIGVHQAGACTAKQAVAESAETPITLGGGSIGSHFRIVDPMDAPDLTRGNVVYGKYGDDRLGKYVYAFPVKQSDVDKYGGLVRIPAGAPAYPEGDPASPSDLITQAGDHADVVNPKYCAGFIDEDGRFHENTDFMAMPVLSLSEQ